MTFFQENELAILQIQSEPLLCDGCSIELGEQHFLPFTSQQFQEDEEYKNRLFFCSEKCSKNFYLLFDAEFCYTVDKD